MATPQPKAAKLAAVLSQAVQQGRAEAKAQSQQQKLAQASDPAAWASKIRAEAEARAAGQEEKRHTTVEEFMVQAQSVLQVRHLTVKM
jgi:hypothetical protein